jgi:hypothetical protein
LDSSDIDSGDFFNESGLEIYEEPQDMDSTDSEAFYDDFQPAELTEEIEMESGNESFSDFDCSDFEEFYSDEIEAIDPFLDSDGDGLPDVKEIEIGTDPENPDTDSDGIMDGKEIEDGTDPADPSSAKEWHPELTEHPRLFFTADDIPELALRTEAVSGPWSVLFKRIKSIADQNLPSYKNGFYDPSVSSSLGTISEAAAFLGLILENEAYTQKALNALIMEFPDPSNVTAEQEYNLWESEALVPLCTAYDYLAGNAFVSAENLQKARANLVKRLDYFRFITHNGTYLIFLSLAHNNHAMKVFGAFGICALVLNDRKEAALDMSEAMTGLDYILNNFQSSADGGYAEGWSYLVFGSNSFVPFITAYHRWAQGKTLPYFAVPDLQFDSPSAGKIVPVMDFADNEITKNIFHMALWSSQPDGLMPPTDDCNPVALQGAVVASFLDDPAFLWQWFKTQANFLSGGMNTASFILYDGSEPPVMPSEKLEDSAIEAGFAIFRNSWQEDALYLVLQGEHEKMRLHGLGHEHPDELSFILWAYGQPLILDPGYISWALHSKVNKPSDHNTILVDGKGSPVIASTIFGADAYLSEMAQKGSAASVYVTTNYENVNFKRRVVRIKQEFFITEDRIEASKKHTYSFLLNGYGGGDVPDSSFQMQSSCAQWNGKNAGVKACILPVTGTGVYSSSLEEHSTAWNKWQMHERLKVEAEMNSPSGFLSVIFPFKAGENAPEINSDFIDGVIVKANFEIDDQKFLIISNHGTSTGEIFFGKEKIQASPGLTIAIFDNAFNLLEFLDFPQEK